MTIMMVVGKWGGIHVYFGSNLFSVTLGFVSFQVWGCEVDELVSNLFGYLEKSGELLLKVKDGDLDGIRD